MGPLLRLSARNSRAGSTGEKQLAPVANLKFPYESKFFTTPSTTRYFKRASSITRTFGNGANEVLTVWAYDSSALALPRMITSKDDAQPNDLRDS